MKWLGLDIGGANLKAADGRGWARSVPFPLWRDPGGLADAINALVDSAPAAERFAVTMTGELCDAFRTRLQGVQTILAAVQYAADGRKVDVYLVTGQFVTIDEARQQPELASASNWHALAKFACRFVKEESGLLIDVGSTTTDIVPLILGAPRPAGFTDVERLLSRELVYTGVGRTPVCAITPVLPWRGLQCPVAAEVFATSADAYVLLEKLPEEPDANWTADGRPLTKEFARERLARMICVGPPEFNTDDALQVAYAIKAAQDTAIQAAVRQVVSSMKCPPKWVVSSGAGDFAVEETRHSLLPNSRLFSLLEHYGKGIAAAAPAHALALLAAESVELIPGRKSMRNH